MISKDEIKLMIENIDTAVTEAKKNYELAVSLLAIPEINIAQLAAAIQLRPAKNEGSIVQGSNASRKDLALLYERALKEKNNIDAQLFENIKKAGYELDKATTFLRLFNSPILSGLNKSILTQRFKEKKKYKEITWNGRAVTDYEVKTAYKEIENLQRRMSDEGFD